MSAETPQANMAERITEYIAVLRKVGLIIGVPKAIPVVLDIDIFVGRPPEHVVHGTHRTNPGGFAKVRPTRWVTDAGHRAHLPLHAFESASALEREASTLVAADGRLAVVRVDRQLGWSSDENGSVRFDFRWLGEPRTEAT